MNTFAFIIHPIDAKRDVSRKFPLLGRILSERQINFFSTFFPPVYISEINGITSAADGSQIRGWFIACPYTPTRMMTLPENTVYRKIIQTGRLAERLGADILGLGAYTSVVGDGGVTIEKSLQVPVTTGDSYTIAIAVEAVRKASKEMGIRIEDATVAVVGATGAIGKVCAQILAEDATKVFLIGRRIEALDALKKQIEETGARAEIHASDDLEAIRHAQCVITVTSDTGAVINPEHLQIGSVICDVARPRDVSAKVVARRNDVLVIDGGMVDVPGPVNFNFDFGFPAGKAYACMAETMALALEGRFENFTLGKDITRSQVKTIDSIAQKHGFRLSGFRSFEKAVTDSQIASIKARAEERKSREMKNK